MLQQLTPTALTAQSIAQSKPSQADLERRRHIHHAWEAYRGKLPQPLKVSADQPNDNVLANRCAPIVDKGVSFLFGKQLKIEAATEAQKQAKDAADEAGLPEAPKKETPTQDFLDGIWGDDDDKMTLLSQLAINGGVCGQTFAKLIPAQGMMKFPRIVVLNPELIRIVTAPDDCSLTVAYIIEYPIGDGTVQKRQVIARVDPDGLAEVAGEYDLDDIWTITNYIRNVQYGSVNAPWIQVGSQEVWPYPFAPIFCCQNLPNPNEPWGTPDLTLDIIEMNRVLNFVQSNTSRIIKYHAHPKTWAKGIGASQIQIAVDDVIVLQSDTAQIGVLEMHSDLASSLNFAANLRADMDEQSRVPAVALGRTAELPKGNISGVALQLLFQPLIEKTVMKQRLYGKLVREISRAALVLGGLVDITDYEDEEIELHWQNLLPVDDLAAAQTAQILQTLGVSDSTILQQLGYDADAETMKSASETAKKAALLPAPQKTVAQDTQQQKDAGMGNE